MERLTRLRPSPAMVVALLALLVALGGTSFAAVKLSVPNNSVGTAQLKSGAVTSPKLAANAVTSSKITDHSIRFVDIAPGQVPSGPSGARGPTGAHGPTGPGARWALVSKDGQVLAQSSGLNVTVMHPEDGNFYVNFGSPLTGHVVEATSVHRDSDVDLRGNPVVSICGGGAEGSQCPASDNSSTVWVQTYGPHNMVNFDHSFYIAVF